MNLRITIILFLIYSHAFCQVGGEDIFYFLNVSTSARQQALGGHVLNLRDDVNQPNWNPASINEKMDNQISFNYMSFLSSVSYSSLNFAHLINRRIGTVFSSINYVNYGSFVAADEQGIETGKFSAYDSNINFGYSYNIPWSNFFIGTNLKFIQSSIANFKSTGIGFDFSILYYNDTKPFSIAIVARNIGTQLSKFDQKREKLPLDIEAGMSYNLLHVPLTWYITLVDLQQWQLARPNPSNQIIDFNGNIFNEKISFINNAIRHVVIGAELFRNKGFNIRLGYNFRRANELKLATSRTFAGFSAGFGLRMGNFKFNYGFAKYHPSSNLSTFTIQYDLNRNNFKN